MGLLSDLFKRLGGASAKGRQAAKGVQAEDISNVIGAMRGNKQDKAELLNRAKDIIPGQLDDIVIDGMASGTAKPAKAKKADKK